MKFVLIGNYTKDCQESMERFALMLQEGFESEGVPTKILRPIILFGYLTNNTITGIGKWLGYLDKWTIFPIFLRMAVLKNTNKEIFYHVCDHSNAYYLKQLPNNRSGITCHDVLAIRGALGFKDAYCNASKMGVVLQKWILKNLVNATNIACVSKLTLVQLNHLANRNENINRNWRVIHNSFNAKFKCLDNEQSKNIQLKEGILIDKPYIFHVGSNLPRKNRVLLIEVLNILKNEWDGNIVFGGKGMDDNLKKIAISYGLVDRIIEVPKPKHDLLNALYSGCIAFIFPSFSEGFGWPIIEAQASGTPVIASDFEPLPEVSGAAAVHINPHNQLKFAEALRTIINSPQERSLMINRGIQNAKQYSTKAMIDQYLKLYNLNND